MKEGIARRQRGANDAGGDSLDPLLFSSAFGDYGVDPSMLVTWHARAAAVGASALSAEHGTALLRSLWSRDKYMARLGVAGIGRLERFLDFAVVASGRNIIEQDEHGDFMIVLLSG